MKKLFLYAKVRHEAKVWKTHALRNEPKRFTLDNV